VKEPSPAYEAPKLHVALPPEDPELELELELDPDPDPELEVDPELDVDPELEEPDPDEVDPDPDELPSEPDEECDPSLFASGLCASVPPAPSPPASTSVDVAPNGLSPDPPQDAVQAEIVTASAPTPSRPRVVARIVEPSHRKTLAAAQHCCSAPRRSLR
jgi:pilus assembly protein FimV